LSGDVAVRLERIASRQAPYPAYQLKSLKFVGGALVVVATAIWAVFKWYAG